MLEFLKIIPNKHGPEEITKFQEYKNKLIKPYLEQKKNLDSNIFKNVCIHIQGYLPFKLINGKISLFFIRII